MALETVEAGNRLANGPGLGGGKSFPATSASEPTLAPLALQAQKIVTRYGLSASLARTVAELAFNPGRRR
jgi:hypothetical protein